MTKIDLNNFTNKQKCLFGAMVGDIIGGIFEFKRPSKINTDYITYPNLAPYEYCTYPEHKGSYSDDFSQTLCVEECIKNSARDFPTEMLAWRYGKYWVNKKLFDCGMQTAIALEHFAATGSIKYENKKSGNGGIMRLAPVAFVPNMKYNTQYYSELTHNSVESMKAAEFYVALLSIMNDTEHVVSFDMAWHYLQDGMEWDIPSSNKDDLGSGYVIDTLNSIRHCINGSTSYTEAVTMAIKLGNDTDTTATCVGAVAALYFGIDDISDEWLEYIQPSLQNPYVKKLFDIEE